MNQITRLPTTENLAPTTPFSAPWLSRLRRGLGEISGRPTLMTGMVPSEQERAEIPALTSTLRRQLFAGPADRQNIASELARLFAAFPAQEQSDAPASLRIEAYFDAIGTAPAWAVREARLRVVRGEAGLVDTRFAPTPPQFAGIVRAVMRPLMEDLADLDRLSAIVAEHVPSPAERERVKQGFADLKHSFPESQKRKQQTDPARAKIADAQLRGRLREQGKSDEEIDTIMNDLEEQTRNSAFKHMKVARPSPTEEETK